MSCLYWSVDDLLGHICSIRDKSCDQSCLVHWAAKGGLLTKTSHGRGEF